ncbi:MAG: hypothetical protein ACR2LX_04470 [Jatrophihabitans sp.]
MDENIRDGWAAASIRVRAPDVRTLAIPQNLLNAGEINRSGKTVVFSFRAGEEVRLQELLDDAKRFVTTNLDVLAALQGCEIDLFLGWSPMSPQESLLIESGLVRDLGRIGAGVVFDTYSE